MEADSIAVSYGPDSAELTLNAEINEPSALALESALIIFFRYYQYPAVLLRINSNGGELVALHHILKSLESWRAAGCQILTEASFRAGSAATVLLSLGDVGSRRV